MQRLWFTALCLLILTGGLWAQGNPFELRYRLSLEERQAIVFSERNPFELIRGEEAEAIQAYLPGVVRPSASLIALDDERYLKAPGLLFWIYLGLLVLATILVNLGRTQIGRWFRALINDQLTISLLREKERGYSLPYILWYLFFFLNGGIFLYQSCTWWTEGLFPGDNPIFLLWFSLGIAGFYVLKHLLLSLFGWIFPIQKAIRHYSFNIMLFNAVLGIVLFPMNIGISYAEGFFQDIFMYLAIGLIAITVCLRLLRGLLIGLPFLSSSPLHFFLYLCAVELGPVLLLVKWLSTSQFYGT